MDENLISQCFVYGIGIFTGVLLKKYIFTSGAGSAAKEVTQLRRAAKLATIRAKNLGRNHKMVFVVRNDLGMGKGKIAAQCSHAALSCFRQAQIHDEDNLDIWEATGQTKVALKCDGGEEELRSLQKLAQDKKIVNALVRDAGYTQVEPGSLTVLGLGPAPVAAIDELTGHLKLL